MMDRAAFSHVFIADEYKTILTRLRSGDSVIDCGANIGCFTLRASRRVGPSGCVIAIEPHPDNAEQLRKNVELNAARNVQIIEAALSNVDKSTVLIDGDGVAAHVAEARGITVKTATLSSIVKEHNLPNLKAVKMDIEGSEVDLFSRSEEASIMATVQSLVIEIHSLEAERHILRVLARSGQKVRGPLFEHAYSLRIARNALIHPVLIARLYGRDAPSIGIRLFWGPMDNSRRFSDREVGAFAPYNIEAIQPESPLSPLEG